MMRDLLCWTRGCWSEVAGFSLGACAAGLVFIGANALAGTGLSPFGPSPSASLPVLSASPFPSLSQGELS